jgi:hypothetical protein
MGSGNADSGFEPLILGTSLPQITAHRKRTRICPSSRSGTGVTTSLKVLGRYARAAGEVQKAADAAALAAVREVDVTLWREDAEFAFLPSAYGLAQEYADRNAAYLGQYGIGVSVTAIWVDPELQAVGARCRADVSRLFPAWVPVVVIERQGAAQVAWR